MKLVTINGVRGFIDETGTAQLNLEDESRGLGFTQVKNDVEYIRWETVTGYLLGFGFSQQVGKDSFVPENIFYRLAMKAKNDAAEAFQSKVADEILPSIRKTGSYSIQNQLPQTLPEALRLYANQIEETQKEKAEKLLLQSKIEADQPKVQFAETCMTSNRSILVREVAKLASKQGVLIGERRLYQKLRDWGMMLKHRNEPSQTAMDMGLFEIKKGVYAHPDGARDYETPKVTIRGQEYIINRLIREAA